MHRRRPFGCFNRRLPPRIVVADFRAESNEAGSNQHVSRRLLLLLVSQAGRRNNINELMARELFASKSSLNQT